MPNRPGRPSGGPPMAQRLAQYLVVRTRGLTNEEAAEAMNVSRAAICQYARRLRELGQLTPVPAGIHSAQRCRMAAYEARIADYAALRSGGASPMEALAQIGLAAHRENARRYEYTYRNPGQKLSAPQPRKPSRYRAAVLEHMRKWPDSLFSIWDLSRVLARPLTGKDQADPRLFQNALHTLTDQGLIEAIDGMRYPSDQKVPARRYRLAASARLSPAPAVQEATDV